MSKMGEAHADMMAYIDGDYEPGCGWYGDFIREEAAKKAWPNEPTREEMEGIK